MVPTSSQLADALIESVAAHPDLVGEKVSALVSFLEEFHLMNLMPQIRRVIAYRIDLEARARGCSVSTALPLDDVSRQRLLEALGMTASNHVVTSVDESLIGGAIIANRGVMYDASLRTSLERLRFILKN